MNDILLVLGISGFFFICVRLAGNNLYRVVEDNQDEYNNYDNYEYNEYNYNYNNMNDNNMNDNIMNDNNNLNDNNDVVYHFEHDFIDLEKEMNKKY